ncbi:amidohydrolase [Spirillospora sp. NPDC029432]|uniref:amidohydrolase n=1 Tax=Spirillospora sp. NPDC029432 TaxID=3154599 RepID=UPI003455ABE9
MSDKHMTTRRSVIKGGGAALAALGVSSLGLPHAQALAKPGPADLVLYNGKVLTLDRHFRVAEAVAIKNGVIVHVGTSASVKHLVGAGTDVVDLKGRTAMPGVNDSHLHAVSWGLSRPPFSLDVGYPTVDSIADIAASVAQAVEAAGPGTWIRGRGWDPQYLGEGRKPTRQDLDAVSPNNPVYLTEWSGHAAWVNSEALRIAGVTRDTVPPAGGQIVKDADGEPTGLLLETAAGLVGGKVPPHTLEEQAAAAELAARMMPAEGITSYTDPGSSPALITAVAGLVDAGRIPVRVSMMLSGSSPESLRANLEAFERPDVDPRRFTANQVKIFADGIPTINKTAWLFEEYVGGGHGGLTLPGSTPQEQVATLEELVRMAHTAGFQIGTHATGDRTIDAVITAYERQHRTNPQAVNPRHYIIHGDLARPSDLARMARASIGGNFNPNIKWVLADAQIESIGMERAAYEWPYATALRSGVRVASASDAPVVYPDFRQGLETMVRREGRLSGRVYGPGERISLDKAIATYTRTGAWQDHAESWKGQLAKGYAGDIVVLDGDVHAADTAEISDMSVAMTVVGGTVAYDEGSSDVKRAAAAARGASWVKRHAPMNECGHGTSHKH